MGDIMKPNREVTEGANSNGLGWQLLFFVTPLLGVTYPYYPGNLGNTPITPVINFVAPN